jgi:hypothetical protein
MPSAGDQQRLPAETATLTGLAQLDHSNYTGITSALHLSQELDTAL